MNNLALLLFFVKIFLTLALEKVHSENPIDVLITDESIYNSLLSMPKGLQPLRKCCSWNEFYSGLTQQCEKTPGIERFQDVVKELLIRSHDIELSPIYQRIPTCPETFTIPKNVIVSLNTSHHLFEDGSVFYSEEVKLYNITHYCLELVGTDVESSVLVFAYCPQKEFYIPKCCQKNHYFDSRINDCSAYYFVNGSEGDSTLFSHTPKDYSLVYKELLCLDVPVHLDLRDVRFNQDAVCLDNLENCYAKDKYCVENYLDANENSIFPVVFACPDYFINKCCPDDQSLYTGGCTISKRRSISILHILKNQRYQTRSASRQGSKCNPVTIEDETRSDIAWEVNSFGLAVIKKGNKTIHTRNYCIDDFVTETEVLPVIKVCSEEINEYHEVSSINDWENTFGKCCPSGMVYHPNAAATHQEVKPLCIKEDLMDIHSVEEMKDNLPNLVYYGFPTCGDGKEAYHHYQMQNQSRDFAEITTENTLRIVYNENECTTKETELEPKNFCVDFMIFEENLKPVAIVCAPSLEAPHPERNFMTVAFIAASCTALIFTLFSLIFTRVRRGMVTMKKMNTLAGRILISYVTSQLLSFATLSIGVLVDFQEDVHNCFILGGFILFLSLASFCWNTSICFEGLLLTLHVKTSEKRRFLYHCIWAWGVPALITSVALIRDLHREELPCDAITPKFGLENCFFSDLVAKILYFFLPISITVILNGVFLITARIIRRTQLKELEKDPHRIRRHGTIKEVFSIKNRKSIKEKKKHQRSTHSGLRTHHFQNMWLETTKLALWSGGTWIMELVAVTITLNFGRSQGEWYQYLWYLPVGFNCLRGVGIFIIIVLTPDNKTRFARTVKTFYSNVGQSVLKSNLTFNPHHSRAQSRKSLSRLKSSSVATQPGKQEQRKISISTVLTYLSSTQESFEDNDSIKRPAEYCHSISQLDVRKSSYGSGLSDVFEDSEHDSDACDDHHIINFSRDPMVGNDYCRINIEEMDYCTHL